MVLKRAFLGHLQVAKLYVLMYPRLPIHGVAARAVVMLKQEQEALLLQQQREQQQQQEDCEQQLLVFSQLQLRMQQQQAPLGVCKPSARPHLKK
jgi:hypothetical protein